jgi:hypothetical protein
MKARAVDQHGGMMRGSISGEAMRILIQIVARQ